MSRIVYVNGAYVPEEEARISVFDRGFLFADAVYEVTSVLDGRLVDLAGHLRRLHRSLGRARDAGAGLRRRDRGDPPRARGAERACARAWSTCRSRRGAADRDFACPAAPVPSLVMFTQGRPLVDTAAARDGIRVIAVPDIRWARRDIKTVQLLAPSMCKMMAKQAGKDDAWMVEDGFVTEGTSNNAYIVTRDGAIVTRDLSTGDPARHHPRGGAQARRRGAAPGRGAAVHARGGDGGGRGLHDRRFGLRDAGGGDRRAGRSATAGPGPSPGGCASSTSTRRGAARSEAMAAQACSPSIWRSCDGNAW